MNQSFRLAVCAAFLSSSVSAATVETTVTQAQTGEFSYANSITNSTGVEIRQILFAFLHVEAALAVDDVTSPFGWTANMGTSTDWSFSNAPIDVRAVHNIPGPGVGRDFNPYDFPAVLLEYNFDTLGQSAAERRRGDASAAKFSRLRHFRSSQSHSNAADRNLSDAQIIVGRRTRELAQAQSDLGFANVILANAQDDVSDALSEVRLWEERLAIVDAQLRDLELTFDERRRLESDQSVFLSSLRDAKDYLVSALGRERAKQSGHTNARFDVINAENNLTLATNEVLTATNFAALRQDQEEDARQRLSDAEAEFADSLAVLASYRSAQLLSGEVIGGFDYQSLYGPILGAHQLGGLFPGSHEFYGIATVAGAEPVVISEVPLPAGGILLLSGLVGAAGMARRKRKAA